MNENIADFNILGNIEPQIEKPLDNRITALKDFNELTLENTWRGKYLYNGMIVPIIPQVEEPINPDTQENPLEHENKENLIARKNSGIYMLINKDNPQLKSSWMQINGGGFGSGNFDGGRSNEVYVKETQTLEGGAAGSFM